MFFRWLSNETYRWSSKAGKEMVGCNIGADRLDNKNKEKGFFLLWNIDKIDFFSGDVGETGYGIKLGGGVSVVIVGKVGVRVSDQPAAKSQEVGMDKESRAAVISSKKHCQQYREDIATTCFYVSVIYILDFSHSFQYAKII